MMNDEPVEQMQESQLIVVDANVVVDGGYIHHYVGVSPIKYDLDNRIDWLLLYWNDEMVASYSPGYWKAVETFHPRFRKVRSRDETRRKLEAAIGLS